MHEITAGHRSLSGTLSSVTDRICFLPVTMTGRFSNFNISIFHDVRHWQKIYFRRCLSAKFSKIISSDKEYIHKYVYLQQQCIPNLYNYNKDISLSNNAEQTLPANFYFERGSGSLERSVYKKGSSYCCFRENMVYY